MLDNLKLKNPDIKLYSVNSEEFKTFGRVITGLDTSEIIKAAEKISRPAEGSAYTPSEESFEKIKEHLTAKGENFSVRCLRR